MPDVKKKIQYWIILNDSPENQFPDADFASWYSNVQGKAYSLMQRRPKKGEKVSPLYCKILAIGGIPLISL